MFKFPSCFIWLCIDLRYREKKKKKKPSKLILFDTVSLSERKRWPIVPFFLKESGFWVCISMVPDYVSSICSFVAWISVEESTMSALLIVFVVLNVTWPLNLKKFAQVGCLACQWKTWGRKLIKSSKNQWCTKLSL